MSSAQALPAAATTAKRPSHLGSAASLCLGGAGLQRGRDFVGRGGPRHQLRRRLRRSLAAVQRGRGADPSAPGNSDRACPSHEQRPHRHRGFAAAGVDISQHSCGTPGTHTAIAAAVFTFNEALLGALLVLLRLTADNRSPARAVYLSLHLANTLLLLGALALSAHFLSRGEAFTRRTVRFTQLPLGDHRTSGHPGSGSDRNPGRAQRYALSRNLA